MLIVVMMTMMFNGLVCGDSDGSDFTKDSGASSCAGAGGGGGGGGERYYRDKLLATLRILENKEETIRVQASSLRVAEARIAELSERAAQRRRGREPSEVRQRADSCGSGSDAGVAADIKEAAVRGRGRERLVGTLRDNLALVSDLYRECFYEAAKQEGLIDLFRHSYLDVRLMEKDKADEIRRLQNVVDTQKRSIEQCQDVVVEVESLRSEICSFLNSSNNDSGVWERGSEGAGGAGGAADVGEELADILEQLRQLHRVLTSDCTCGLEEENKLLKERNITIEAELEQVRRRNMELDGSLRNILNQQYEKQLKEKEREFQEVMDKLLGVENTCKERREACDTLTRQLQQTQVMLDDNSAELAEAQRASADKDETIRGLRRSLQESEQLVQETLRKLSEVAQSRSEVVLEGQARAAELEQRLRRAARRARDLEAECRERDLATCELEASLQEAHVRGARLCDESRGVAAAVRQWMRDKRRQTREQEEKIKMQRKRIHELERCVATGHSISDGTSQSDTEPTHSRRDASEIYPRCSRVRSTCRSEASAYPRSLAGRVDRENETASCSKCTFNRHGRQESASETASCSRVPEPPTRKKRQSCDDLSCPLSRASRAPSPPPGPAPRPPDVRRPRRAAPADTERVRARVRLLQASLERGRRRWGRARR